MGLGALEISYLQSARPGHRRRIVFAYLANRSFFFEYTGYYAWPVELGPWGITELFLWAFVTAFLPPLLVAGLFYGMEYRLQQEQPPKALQHPWQVSLKGLLVLTCDGSLLFASVCIAGTELMKNPFQFRVPQGSEESAVVLVLSTALTALLSGVILICRNWQVTATILSFLTFAYASGAFGERNFWGNILPEQLRILVLATLGLALGNMISLVITRYCIGHGRFILTCSRPEPLPSPTASKDVL